jgi:peptidoglycan/xylan/chitin deacetylase (PgdA/CDA1 family)
MLGSPRKRLRHWADEHLFAKPGHLRSTEPLFTFTFDDVPRSACVVGGRILEEARVRGTFYVVGKLSEKGGLHATFDDLAALHARGHHIACHTYSHEHGSQISARAICLDAARNRALLSQKVSAPIEDFAWPAGEVNRIAKRSLRNIYRSIRCTRPGINSGRVDLACLRAVSLYGPTFSRERVLTWMRRCADLRGWLIFYTHDVKEPAGRVGTSPEDLSWLLKECTELGRVLTVREGRERVVLRS